MKQWNAKGVLTLSMLSLSLVAGYAHAQVAGSGTNEGSIQTQVDDSNTNTSIEDNRAEQNTISNSNNNVPLNLRNSRIESRAVEVTPGMSPTVVAPAPVAVAPAPGVRTGVQLTREGDAGLSVGAPSTGIGGANPGNANTGGVQVQSVNVQTSQDLDAKNRADVLRRERVRQELENETRLIEKVEEGRLDDERTRSNQIGGFNASATAAATAQAKADGAAAAATAQASAGSVTTVPVTAVGSGATATAVAVGSTGSAGSADLSAEFRDERHDSRFAISPFVGHRWNESGYTEFKVQNTLIVGANLSGQMNDFFALEGSFTYGRDNLNNRYGGGYGSIYGNSYGGGCGTCGGGGGGYYGQAGYYNNNYSNGYSPYASNGYSTGYGVARSRDTFDIAANAKLGLFTSKFRPYGLIGLGGSVQHYNIDNGFTDAQARVAGWDRNTTHLTGQFGGGVDVELSNKFTVGARFDYQKVFSENKYVLMNQLYGDGLSRYRLTANAQLLF